jgi:hypothetical protein
MVEPVSPDRTSDVPLNAWRLIDWRFLLPSVLTRIGFIGMVSREEIRALAAAHLQVFLDPLPDDGLGAVIITTGDPDQLLAATRLLRPGGWLLVRLGPTKTGPRSRLRGSSPDAWIRRLTDQGLTNCRAYWHAPNVQRCAYIVDLKDRVAVDAMLQRYEGVRFGHMKSLAARALLRLGLVHLIARDVTVVGERPISRGPTATTGTPDMLDAQVPRVGGGTPAELHSSTLVVTPWFEASRHVLVITFDPLTSGMTTVAKFPRRYWDTGGIAAEAQALRAIDRGSDLLAGHVPHVRRIDLGPRPYLLETALEGPHVSPEYVRRHTSQVVRAGTDLIGRMSLFPQPGKRSEWYGQLLDEPLGQFADSVPMGGTGRELVTETRRVLEPLRQAILPLVLEHGDLGHPNLIMTSKDRMAAIDWERYEAHGLPLLDLVFFLQYVAECRASAVTLPAQLRAFDDAFVGPQAWAAPWLRQYALHLGIDSPKLPLLVLAAWVRTSTGLVARLVPRGDASRHRLTKTPDLSDTFRKDRDFGLWRHALARYPYLLGPCSGRAEAKPPLWR